MEELEEERWSDREVEALEGGIHVVEGSDAMNDDGG